MVMSPTTIRVALSGWNQVSWNVRSPVEAQLAQGPFRARAGQRLAVGVVLAVEKAREDTHGHAHRLDLLAGDRGELLSQAGGRTPPPGRTD